MPLPELKFGPKRLTAEQASEGEVETKIIKYNESVVLMRRYLELRLSKVPRCGKPSEPRFSTKQARG